MSDQTSPHLTVLIPAYNEAGRLRTTLEGVLAYLAGREYEWELLVVDDGSLDETVKVAEDAFKGNPRARVVRNSYNQGKGYSVRHGMIKSSGELVLFMDADHSTPIEEVEKLEAEIASGADAAIGSRALRQSRVEVHQPRHREVMGKAFNLMVRAMAVRGFRDTQCGFKLFTRKAVEILITRQMLDGFSFDVELLFIAKRHGLKVAEVPVRWINSPMSRVHALRAPASMAWDLLRIRANSLRGLYD